MKRVMLMMVLAALLLTQCKKPSIEFPTPSVTTTVSMTITAGPGSKTDITTEGGIVWSENDKIYVGDGSKYVGYLTLVGDGGDATGTFTGDVTVGTGDDCTFHFYYLGNAKDYDAEIKDNHNLNAVVDFSSQDIYADNDKLKNASGHHVGYGKAEHVKVEADKPVTGLQVSMKSKVAIAYFCFQKGEGVSATPYEGALTLSGTNICNKMTVNFSGAGFGREGTEGGITLEAGHAERYVMLVPTGTDSETLNFGGAYEGTTTLANGIEANKFYRVDGSMPIVVTVEKVKPFTVGMDDNGKPIRVEFSPGNLWANATDAQHTVFYFEANQWGTNPSAVGQTNWSNPWNSSHVSHFKWSNVAGAVAAGVGYSGELFCNNNFTVDGDSHSDWRTLSNAEWAYLLNSRTDANRFAKAKVNGVHGLLIFPDGYNGTTSGDGIATLNTANAAYPGDNIPDDKWSSMESSGAVFLPAAGYRDGTTVLNIGELGYYWSSTSNGSDGAYAMYFTSNPADVGTDGGRRDYGLAVRLVR